LCAFAINDDGADTLTFAPLFKILGSATVNDYYYDAREGDSVSW